MNVRQIYDVALYAENDSDFVKQVAAKCTDKNVQLNTLIYFDPIQRQSVIEALKTWRPRSETREFVWPFLSYKYKDEKGQEVAGFTYGEQDTESFLTSLEV